MDNQSTNGTFVNGRRVKEQALAMHDMVRIGDTLLRLVEHGIYGQANHRYLTDPAAIDATVARGWSVEGPVFCVPH